VLNVISVGLGRTGTGSLKVALEKLGFAPCYHLPDVIRDPERIAQWARVTSGDRADWDAIFSGYRATAFWPAAAFWREIVDHYPRARVILTVRDADGWYESARNTIFRTPVRARTRVGRLSLYMDTITNPALRPMRGMMRDAVWNRIFPGGVADRDHAVAGFERHNREVRLALPPERLLVYDIADGWVPLCAFLGLPVPALPFPRANDTAAFLRANGTVR
jgi:Sulfotransferase domain